MPIAVIAVVVLAIVGVGAYFLTNTETPEQPNSDTNQEVVRNDSETPTEPMPQEDETAGSGNDDPAGSSMPDDETAAATPYLSEQTYLTPARTSHELEVSLSVADDGTVVGANVTYDNQDGYSNSHQERFDEAYRDEVVGKKLSEIELSRVGGASLTSEAFNEAVADIRSQVG
jgi:cytoskeletal protein RodZ